MKRKINVDESGIVFEVLSSFYDSGVMIDVGAHIGGSLSPFVRYGWKVIAFEPDPSNRERLVERFGEYANIEIHPEAISDRELESATLFRSKTSSGISGLSVFEKHHSPSGLVKVITLSSFLENISLDFSNIKYLKIDTEGYDLFVLKGFPWHRCLPPIILCEFENKKTKPLGYSFEDLCDFLIDMNYSLIVSEWKPIVKYGGAHDWLRFSTYPCSLSNNNAWGNIFAVKDEALYSQLLKKCNLC